MRAFELLKQSQKSGNAYQRTKINHQGHIAIFAMLFAGIVIGHKA